MNGLNIKIFFSILIIVLLIPGPVKATNPHGLPFSPAEIQQWKNMGERSLYHYREFYYTNPDKGSPWRQAVCVRIKIIFDITERITNIAFLRFGKVYVFDRNVKTGKYEYRKDLSPKHRNLWTQGFLKTKAVPKKQIPVNSAD